MDDAISAEKRKAKKLALIAEFKTFHKPYLSKPLLRLDLIDAANGNRVLMFFQFETNKQAATHALFRHALDGRYVLQSLHNRQSRLEIVDAGNTIAGASFVSFDSF